MTRLKIISMFVLLLIGVSVASAKSTRQERRSIIEGNELFAKKNYSAAISSYNKALASNPESRVAMYNRAMAQVFIGLDTNNKNEEAAKKLLQNGTETLQHLAADATQNKDISSRAAYNLGNIAFNNQDMQTAAEMYKQALRCNPDNDDARRNLRIVQLKQQQKNNQDKNNQNKNNNKEKEKNKDKQDNQNKENKSKENKNKSDQNQQQPSRMDKQTSDQVLNSIENRENQIRQRLQGRRPPQSERSRPTKPW